MNMITDTGVPGCGIRYQKNHNGQWCVFPLINITENCDGLKELHCVQLAEALRVAAVKIRELNTQEETKMLFEGAD